MYYLYANTMQGQIHACAEFGKYRDKILMNIPGVHQVPFDPSTFIYHVGPLAGTGASLAEICAHPEYKIKEEGNMESFKIEKKAEPLAKKPPVGFAIICTHVDDLPGGSTNHAVIWYICNHIAQYFPMKCVGWQHAMTLGALFQHNRLTRVLTISAGHLVDKVVQQHLSGEVMIQPKHCCTPAIMHLSDVDPQANGPPDPSVKQVTQSLLGSLQYLGNFYPMVLMPTNRNGAFAADPHSGNLRSLKYTTMFLNSNRQPLTFGGMDCTDLESDSAPPDNPYSVWAGTGKRYYKLSGWTDANLEHPRSTSCIMIKLCGVAVDYIVCRQHCTCKTVHDSETVACSDAVARIRSVRNLLQAFGIPQVYPTPVYCDSDSTTKVSNLEASPRRSLYLMLRSQFITDSFKLGETIVKKIAGTQNPTDDGTKYLPYEQWHRYWQFKLNF